MITIGYNSRTVADYILYLARKANSSITPMQLLKLAYISHGWMLGLYGQPLTKECAEAWKYGPVLPEVYHDFKRYGAGVIMAMPEYPPSAVSGEAANIMGQVFEAYGSYSGIQLSALTHKPGSPWDITWREAGPGAKIPNQLIEEYYRTLAPQKQG